MDSGIPPSSQEELNCGSGGSADGLLGLRIASIFVILVGSTSGALFPVLAARSKAIHIPQGVYNFAKFFGSGVIIATAFIHLLAPALDALSSPCLAPAWGNYPYALALAMLSVFSLFIIEIVAFRWGRAKLRQAGINYDMHAASHQHADSVAASDEEKANALKATLAKATANSVLDDSSITQILGVAILEFGVVFHSILIGLTLAVDANFKVLFVVLVFHQTFEGLGIGSRLSLMKLPEKYSYIPILGALLYGITTPVGIAAGLGVRTTYNPGSTKASIVYGVLDSISAGILLYTGLVELLAHEFLFNKEMINASNRDLALAIGYMLLGCAIMALLGRWA